MSHPTSTYPSGFGMVKGERSTMRFDDWPASLTEGDPPTDRMGGGGRRLNRVVVMPHGR